MLNAQIARLIQEGVRVPRDFEKFAEKVAEDLIEKDMIPTKRFREPQDADYLELAVHYHAQGNILKQKADWIYPKDLDDPLNAEELKQG